jgi:TrmH family RNA methyltransferase
LEKRMPVSITSLQNQFVKDVLKLEKRAVREQQRRLTVEGVREVSRALACGHVPVQAFVCPELVTAPEAEEALRELERLERNQETRLFFVTPEIYAKLVVREGSGGILLVLPYLNTDIGRLARPAAPLLVVVENVEKPGNLGAILRTADAAGVDGVIVCGGIGSTDVHNTNVVRASLGTLFTVPVAEAATPATIMWLRTRGIRIVAATPVGATLYTASDLRGPVAIVLGSEAHGLSQAWLDAADTRVVIPMAGQADSLNLAASTAILLYEAVRQRTM